MGDDGSHVVILVFGEAAAEDYIGLLRSEGAVLLVDGLVAGVVDGIERLHAVAPFGGVFARDDRLGVGVDGRAEGLEVLVLDDAGVGHVGRGVVDHGIALTVGLVKSLRLKAHGTVFELAEAVAVKLVDFAGKNNPVSHRLPMRAVGEEVGVELYIDAVEESVNQPVVTAYGYTLI